MNQKIWLSSPHMGQKEFEYVTEAFDTNWIAPLGPHVDGFEKDLETQLAQQVHVAALSAGTAAIHLALIILDVKAGSTASINALICYDVNAVDERIYSYLSF